jgi:putative ABC transport system ATP-binding protein
VHPRREIVTYIFQSFSLLPGLSAAENVGVPLRIAGMAPKAREERVATMLTLVGLADEPTGQLDAETGKQIMRLIRSAVRSEGVTALLATHDPTLMDIADSVLHLTDGTIVRESQGGQVSGRCPGSRSLLG